MSSRVNKSLFLYAGVFLALIFIAFIFFNHIAILYINTFTAWKIQYNKTQGNLLTKSNIEDLSISLREEGLTARARKAVIDFLPGKSLQKQALCFRCDFNHVTFHADKKIEGAGSAGIILSMPFNSGWKYKKIDFILDISSNSLQINDFKASANQVRMKGFYSASSGKINFNLELAFSPDTTEEYLGEYKDFLFAPNEEGWYTATINAKGTQNNPKISIQSDLFQMNIRAE